MKPLGLSMNKLALDLRVPATRIADIVGARPGYRRGHLSKAGALL
ncbi:MAG TPA: hypothetical protein VFA89_03775 [Terriglobales bacterium]|nr:hypothetical protein [Terriglobales bacterium]